LLDGGQIIRVKKLVEDIFSLLLKLFVDEVLESLPGDALDLLVLVLLAACSGLLVLHFLVVVHNGGGGAILWSFD